MRELLHQLRLGRLVRVVTLYAIRRSERLSLVRFLEVLGLYVVTIDAQLRSGLCQVIVELLLTALTNLVNVVASLTTHVERSVPAAVFRNIQSLSVAPQTEVLAFISGRRLEQLIFVVRLVRIMALDAIADRRRMYRTLELGSIHVRVTGNAQRLRSCGDQLDASYVFRNPHFVTACAASCNC